MIQIVARKTYPEEFRQQAVELYESTPGATFRGIAADLGITRNTLKDWVASLGRASTAGTTARTNATTPTSSAARTRLGSPQAELAALRARIAALEAENTLLSTVRTSADNALAESFNATLKRETLRGAASWPDAASCRREVFRWVTRYNTRRRHSWCGQQAPNAYEQRHAATLRFVA